MSTPEPRRTTRRLRLQIGDASIESVLKWIKLHFNNIRNGRSESPEGRPPTAKSTTSEASHEVTILTGTTEPGDDHTSTTLDVIVMSAPKSIWQDGMDALIMELQKAGNTGFVIIEPTDEDQARYATKKDREFGEMPPACWEVPVNWTPAWEQNPGDEPLSEQEVRKKRRQGVVFDEGVKLRMPLARRQSCVLSSGASQQGSQVDMAAAC
jgi:hypothetical protein